ncbi:efflux RND transporter periplasmic adaptor subunit [Bacillus sp. HMF5848]|uniref:efflux RND transporter periplasmic adaptor subunit n=1 Tax=Bacillus sp. HMF5848 TaxID=2495421 RepID=UPI001639C20C|nr:efflux RND transporter periplasmic adaptor subunit [Bacillus sp. HMF5848]
MQKYIVLICVLLLGTSCSVREITINNESQRASIPVTTIKAIHKTVKESITLPVVATPSQQIPIVVPQPTIVKHVHVKTGDTVTKGQLLIELANDELQQGYDSLNNTVQQLYNRLEQAKTDSDITFNSRIQSLHAELTYSAEQFENLTMHSWKPIAAINKLVQIMSKQSELQQLNTQLTMATEHIQLLQQQVVEAKAALSEIETALRQTKLVAPSDGKILNISVKNDSIATPTTPIATLARLTPMTVIGYVNDYQVSELSTGQEASVTFNGLTSTYETKVKKVSQLIDPQSKMFPIEMSLGNDNEEIKSGSKGFVSIITSEVQDALVIPIDAILYNTGQPYVYIAHNGIAKKKKITVGIREGEHVQILAGLQEGQHIIVNGKERLRDGITIDIQ